MHDARAFERAADASTDGGRRYDPDPARRAFAGHLRGARRLLGALATTMPSGCRLRATVGPWSQGFCVMSALRSLTGR